MSPKEVGDCSFWQFLCAVDGWKKAHGAEEKAQPPTPDEHDELVARFGG